MLYKNKEGSINNDVQGRNNQLIWPEEGLTLEIPIVPVVSNWLLFLSNKNVSVMIRVYLFDDCFYQSNSSMLC